MKKTILIGALALALGACSTTSQKNEAQGQIDIVPAFENPTELKVSHLGKNIRYVPLETTDSSLIGQMYGIKLLDDKILVTSGANCLLFDKQTGKFLCKVSGRGQGPKEYLNSISYVHPQTGDIYFNRTPYKMIRFNQEGKYLDDLQMPFKWDYGCFLTFKDNEAIAHRTLGKNQIHRFDMTGAAIDSIALPSNREWNYEDIKTPIMAEGPATSLMGAGMFATNGFLMIPYKTEERQDFLTVHYPSIYSYKDEMRFHEAYNDTIYRIDGHTLTPQWIFHTGECHTPREMYGDVEESKKRMVVTYVAETEDLLFFECAKEWFTQNKRPDFRYGIYQKKEGTTLIGRTYERITDDLTQFIPFSPTTHSTKGEFAGTLTIEQIQKWLEAHPDIKLEGALAPLAGLADDANPVVVIVEAY